MHARLSPMKYEQLLSISYGEVYSIETINYGSSLPVKGGIFCQRIFGPVKSFECECGRYSSNQYAGAKCDRCKVMCISSDSRAERMGHINLPFPITNPIFIDHMAKILGISKVTFTKSMTGECRFFVLEDKKGLFFLKEGIRVSLVSEKELSIDSSPIMEVSSSIGLAKLIDMIDQEKTLTINPSVHIRQLVSEGFDISDLLMKAILVLPPYYRPIINLGGSYSFHPINTLYLRVLLRSNRIKELMSFPTPDLIFEKESHNLFKAINRLFVEGGTDSKGVEVPSIFKHGLSGKGGIIRSALYGKRVDFSGRSAITSGPDLDIDEIGLPREMAYELFKPFIISDMMHNIPECWKYSKALKYYKSKHEWAISSMEKVVKHRRVIINRAPTLHRFGVMAFRVKLISDKCIRVPPMACAPFNADFDGDSLSGDSYIPLLNGKEMTIPQMMIEYGIGSKVWVYSYDKENCRVVPAVARILGRSGVKSRWVKITFDNGKTEKCSVNHPWISKNGDEILAKDLKVGDEMLSFARVIYDLHSNLWKRNREIIVQPDKEEIATHHMVADLIYGKDRVGHVHHSAIDQNGEFNPFNNDPSVLQLLSKKEHARLHFFDNSHSKFGVWGLDLESKLVDLPVDRDFWMEALGFEFPRGFWQRMYHGNPNITQDLFLDFITNKVGLSYDELYKERLRSRVKLFAKKYLNVLNTDIIEGYYDRGGPSHVYRMVTPPYGSKAGPQVISIDELDTYLRENYNVSERSRPKVRTKYEQVEQGLLSLDQRYLKTLVDKWYLTHWAEYKQRFGGSQTQYQKYTEDHLASIDVSSTYVDIWRDLGIIAQEQFDSSVDYSHSSVESNRDLTEKFYQSQLENDPRKKDYATYDPDNVIPYDINDYNPDTHPKFDKNREPSLLTDPESHSYPEGGVRKVVGIEYLDYTDMSYDLEVPIYHNFATSSGVFTHNTVAVHVPLDNRAVSECNRILSPSQNILGSLDGQPIISPSHEAVIGIHYMTNISHYPNPIVESSLDRLMILHESMTSTGRRKLGINDAVRFRENGKERITCVGRLLIEKVMKTTELPLSFNKSSIKKIISEAFLRLSRKDLMAALSELSRLAFKYATESGISICVEDIVQPQSKTEIVAQAKKEVATIRSDKHSLPEDKFESSMRVWFKAINSLNNEFLSNTDPDNSLLVMYKTGARVSSQQVSQLVSAKGMIADINNKIKEDPIFDSLRDGISPFDYFQSCSGSRKSLGDKKFVTPVAGYTARKLVTACRDFYIIQYDCESTKTIPIAGSKAVGRFGKNGELITAPVSGTVEVRSPIFCNCKHGICIKCYGTDTSTMLTPRMKLGVGVIAAHSLTEVLTQMGLRTFHTGGAASLSSTDKVVKSDANGLVLIEDENDSLYRITVGDKWYLVSKTAKLEVLTGATVKKGDILASFVTNNLSNQDITGTIPRLIALYDLSSFDKEPEAILASRSGEVSFRAAGGEKIAIYVGDTCEGTTTGNVPLLVGGGCKVVPGQKLSLGFPDLRSFFDKGGYLPTFLAFKNEILRTYLRESVRPASIHIEMVYRAMTDFVIKKDGKLGTRVGGDVGKILIKGCRDIGIEHPSFLKSMGFGWSMSALKRAVSDMRWSYDLPSERIMTGEILVPNSKLKGY